MRSRTKLLAAICVLLLGSRAMAEDPTNDNRPETDFKALSAARGQGLDWLTKNQAPDGSWGKSYTIAVTSFACLSYLGAIDKPYTGELGRALVSASNFGIEIDNSALARGFEYLKQCQNEDGGFDCKLGDAQSMKEGTAGGAGS